MAATRLTASIQQARTRIFGEFFNPSCESTGRKYLKEALAGSKIASWYQPYSHATFRNSQRHVLWQMLSVGNERELMHQLADGHELALSDRARVAKLPPKKGKGKRAIRKK